MSSEQTTTRNIKEPSRPKRKITIIEVGSILQRTVSQTIELHDCVVDDDIAIIISDALHNLVRRLEENGRSVSISSTTIPLSPKGAVLETAPGKRRRQTSDTEDTVRLSHLSRNESSSESLQIPTTREEALTIAKPRRTREPGASRARKKPVITLAMSSDCGPLELSQIRTEFQYELLQSNLGDNSTPTYSPLEVKDLTDFFFDEVMGPCALQRLVDLVKSYSPPETGDDEDTIDAGAHVRLKKMAHDKHVPLEIRRFLAIFQHNQRHQNTNPVMVHLQQIIDGRDLLSNYERLRTRIESGDLEIINYLTQRGLTVGVGRGWSSIAIDFLADRVQIKRSTFINMCERAKGVNTLVEHFGEGVLPLLPPGAIHRLRRYGSQKMEPVYRLLKRHVQSFQPMCHLIQDYVYNPFIAGDASLHLDVSYLTTPRRQNFIDILTDAATASQARYDIVEDEQEST